MSQQHSIWLMAFILVGFTSTSWRWAKVLRLSALVDLLLWMFLLPVVLSGIQESDGIVFLCFLFIIIWFLKKMAFVFINAGSWETSSWVATIQSLISVSSESDLLRLHKWIFRLLLFQYNPPCLLFAKIYIMYPYNGAGDKIMWSR